MFNSTISNKVVISCFLAACLEMYDFVIFGFLASVIQNQFLGFLDEFSATIIAYSLFAIGFIFRPLGSIIFGYIGDVYGRKKALVTSVSLMGVGSFFMAVLPPYSSIGVFACYIIMVIRILQGISVGGEYSGAIIFAVEHFPSKKAGLVGGIVISGCISGVLLATLVNYLLKNNDLPEYSWRFAFLLGSGLSVIGYFVRKNLLETPVFLKLKKDIHTNKLPVIEGIKNHFRECLCTIGVAASNGINFYLIIVFLPNYINKLLGTSINYFPVLTTMVLAILSPIFSYLSDNLGRVRMLSWGLLGTAIWSILGLFILTAYPYVEVALIFFLLHGMIYALQAGIANIFIIEVFPVQYRYSCAALCYSIGMGVVGGTSPIIGTLIVGYYEEYSIWLLSTYMMCIPLIGYLCVRYIKPYVIDLGISN